MQVKIIEVSGTADECADVLNKMGHVNSHLKQYAPQSVPPFAMPKTAMQREAEASVALDGETQSEDEPKRKSPSGGEWSDEMRKLASKRATARWARRKAQNPDAISLAPSSTKQVKQVVMKKNEARDAEIVSLSSK